MPDELVVGAGKSLLDVGVVGGVALLLMVAIIFLVRRLFAAQDALIASYEKRLEDARRWDVTAEILKNTMAANTDTMKEVLTFLRARP